MATTVFRNEILTARILRLTPRASPPSRRWRAGRGSAWRCGAIRVQVGRRPGEGCKPAARRHGNEGEGRLRIVLAGEPAGKAVAGAVDEGLEALAGRRIDAPVERTRPACRRGRYTCAPAGSVRLRRDVAAIGDDGGGAPGAHHRARHDAGNGGERQDRRSLCSLRLAGRVQRRFGELVDALAVASVSPWRRKKMKRDRRGRKGMARTRSWMASYPRVGAT